MNEIITAFHIDWKVIIAQAVNFGIVFAVLYIYALKPLSKLMAERAERIKEGLHNAKANEEIRRKSEAEYKDMLARARKEASDILEEGKREAGVKRTEMLEQAKLEVSALIEKGKKSLEAEKEKIVAEGRKEIVNLTMSATEKVVGRKADIY